LRMYENTPPGESGRIYVRVGRITVTVMHYSIRLHGVARDCFQPKETTCELAPPLLSTALGSGE